MSDPITNATKPPLGVTPKWVFEEQVLIPRLNELHGAIMRYLAADEAPNLEWAQEYADIVRRLIASPRYQARQREREEALRTSQR